MENTFRVQAIKVIIVPPPDQIDYDFVDVSNETIKSMAERIAFI